jgi:integrase/recombinase XerD
MTDGTTSALALPASLPPRAAVPALFADAGERSAKRLLEWLTAQIRNPNTRASYARAIYRFSHWCEYHRLRLEDLQPLHAAAYIEELATAVEEDGNTLAEPTVKQHLAALRMLGDYLVTGQIIAANPFAPVRGPKYKIKTGKTVVLAAAEMRQLFESIELRTTENGERLPNSAIAP